MQQDLASLARRSWDGGFGSCSGDRSLLPGLMQLCIGIRVSAEQAHAARTSTGSSFSHWELGRSLLSSLLSLTCSSLTCVAGAGLSRLRFRFSMWDLLQWHKKS
jgi:hypothetical protein